MLRIGFSPEALDVHGALNNMELLNSEQAKVIGLIAVDSCSIEEVCEVLDVDRKSLIVQLKAINKTVETQL